jgi:predicted small lipoprotein YifL
MLRDFIARIRMVAVAFVAAALSVAPLSSCGVKGPLKLPPAPAAEPASAPAVGVPAPDAQPAPSAESPAAPAPKTPETRP